MSPKRTTMSLNTLLIPLFGYFLFLNCHIVAEELKFDSYEQSDYHCGDFLNSTLNDEAMQYVYYFNNEFIRLLSLPFQHEKLFPGDVLTSEIIKQSFTEKTNLWLEHEQWWLSICALLIVGTTVFTVFYLLYRCFVCCCGRSKKPLSSDQKYDNCKRNFLHIIFGLFVIANIFAAAVLILCSQYATHSIEQLPDRVSSCVGDLAIYKTNTQRQIDKLLTDDFNKNSNQLLDSFNNTGKDIVKRFKRGISVDVFDELVAQEKRANQLKNNEIPNLKRLIKEAQNMQSVISNGLTKIKEEYKNVLEHCEPESTPACSIVARTFSTLEVKSPALEKLEIPAEIDTLIDKTIQLNFQHNLVPIENYFIKLENKIQDVANTKQDDAKTRIKEATDTITVVKNDLDKNINNFNFNSLRDGADLLKEQTEKYQPYIQYAWYASLVVAGIFSFIALCFLFGLIYGCCGQRSTYYNDDCCVRPTGSKFYCCGISLALFFMFVFAVTTSVMLIFGSNFNNLICDPWKNPTERQDVVSFVDRFFFSAILEKLGGNTEENLTLSKVVSKCNEGHSFYTILGMDKKLKLSSGFSDDLNGFLADTEIPSQFITNISNDLREVSIDASDKLVKGTQAFESFGFTPIGSSDELISESKRFDLESLDQQLRGKIASKPYAGSPVVAILDQMKDFTPKGKILAAKIVELSDALKHVNLQLEQLNRKPESSKVNLAFNNLIEENSQIRNDAFLNATQEHISSMNKTITAFEDHVRVSMSTQITSCEPIRKLLSQSHSLVCGHLIDAFNAMWMAMLVSLVLFIPMIMITTSLQRLYNNVYAYKYTIHEANTEAAFATDDYAMHEARKFSVSSPYATHNYGYQQDIYPPPYLNQQRYR